MSKEISWAFSLVDWIAVDQQNILDAIIAENLAQVEERIARMHNQQLYFFVPQHTSKYSWRYLYQISIRLLSIKILFGIGLIFLKAFSMT